MKKQSSKKETDIQIVDKHDRKKLGEGRNYGMGFAFCIKKGDVYTTTSPISPCKDYLNDVVFVENTKRPIGSIHGLDYKPKGCLEGKVAYLACSILHYNNSSKEYKHYNEERKALTKNYKFIQQGLNFYEEALDIPKSVVHLVGEDLLIEVPKWWYELGWRISFYTLIVRSLIHYDGEIDVNDFLKTKVSGDDRYLLEGALPKFENIIKLKIKDKLNLVNSGVQLIINKERVIDNYAIHNGGILSIEVPES